MIRSDRIEEAQAAGFTFISAITKSQIKKLLRQGVFQLGLFDTEFAEVLHDGSRYVLRRKPVRQKEMATSRAKMKDFLVKSLKKSNEYLNEHPGEKPETQLRKALKLIEKFKFKGWLSVKVEARTLILNEDSQALKEESKLDGCYVIWTDVKADKMTAKAVHDRYKDLKLLKALEIELPKKAPEAKIQVGTRKKIKPTT